MMSSTLVDSWQCAMLHDSIGLVWGKGKLNLLNHSESQTLKYKRKSLVSES